MGTVLMLVISRYRPPYDRASAKCREHREKWPPENTLWHRFFTAFNHTPPIVGFASIGDKDSVRSIETSGEFVWNLVTRPLAEAMNQTCAAVAPEVSAFELADLSRWPQPWWHRRALPRARCLLNLKTAVGCTCRCRDRGARQG
jgi:hypothetical protein